MKRLDLALIAIIVLCVGFIGYRVLLKGSAATAVPSVVAKRPNQAPLPVVQPARTMPVLTVGNDVLSKLRPVSASDWANLRKVQGVEVASVTPGCEKGQRPKKTVSFPSRDFASQLAAGKTTAFIGLQMRQCLHSKTPVQILSFDARMELPVVERLGHATIGEILRIPDQTLPKMLEFFRLTMANYDELRTAPYMHSAVSPEVFVQLTDFKPTNEKLTRAPKFFIGTKIFNAKKAKAMVANNKAVIFDVRSPEEFKAKHIEGAINVPYHLADGLKPSFQLTKNELSKSTWEYAKALELDRSVLPIVVGRGPEDPIPYFVLWELFRVAHARNGWIYEGVQ